KKIIAMGFMAQCPIAGVIWQHIHYIVALQRLGHEVWYVEDTLNPSYNPVTFNWGDDSTYAAHILGKIAREYGFEGRWAYCARNTPNHDCYGLTKQRMLELYREADMILNICGSQEFNDDILQNPCIVYVESDPTVEQIMVDTGGKEEFDYLRKHRALFTFGENIGTPDFPVPLHGLKWQPTRQPVVTDFWKSDAPAQGTAVFTSIANWSTSGVKDMEWQGDTYIWSKSLEFLKFVEAPMRSGEDFELATNIPDAEAKQKFLNNRWHLVSPEAMSVDYDLYRKYIQSSKGEFTAAKDQYVRLNTAWFSDRSACYLAAGRPVITQETGFTKYYGGHGGLFAFTTLEEIVEAVREINADYPKHCRLAYEIACEYFEAEKVLASLLDRVGI
ncbi:MAG TPA: hypothetical protein VG733_19620, partial [Chthoniobacteraceae bacterium]|nr:hypothetical protein [Chthoniobacteraceae bacterium]